MSNSNGCDTPGSMPAPVIEDKQDEIKDLIQLAKSLKASEGKHPVHGKSVAMGVSKHTLPLWDDLQLLTAQLARTPLLDSDPVTTGVVIGPRAEKSLGLDIPLLVSDMSYGSLSKNAKLVLALGADLAGTGVCSGEGGLITEEKNDNEIIKEVAVEQCNRYLFELSSALNGPKKPEGKSAFSSRDEFEASARDYFQRHKETIKAVHFKGGQAAKTGTGGHLPSSKITKDIARIRGVKAEQDIISPSRFPFYSTPADFKALGQLIKDQCGDIPIGFKLSANHIEEDIQFALDAGADYIILDGRGGSTGSAPEIFRNNISVPTIPALARARRYLDSKGLFKGDPYGVTLIITGGLRTPADFTKALALGADAIALSNSVLQAIGCIGARDCNSGSCDAGIATQRSDLTPKIIASDNSSNRVADRRLRDFFRGAVHMMTLLSRACGYSDLRRFHPADLTTWKPEMAELTQVNFGGRTPAQPEVYNGLMDSLQGTSSINVVPDDALQHFKNGFCREHLAAGSREAYESQRKLVTDQGYSQTVKLTGLNMRFQLIPYKPSGTSVVKPFYMAEFQVTERQWAQFYRQGLNESVNPDDPVTHKSFKDCSKFANALNDKLKETGWKCRLPTRPEWQFAAAAGTRTTFYTGSDALGFNGETLGDLDLEQYKAKKGLAAGTLAPANAFGLFDMFSYLYDFVQKEGSSERYPRLLGGHYGCFLGSQSESEHDSSGKESYFKSFRLVLVPKDW